MFFFCFYQFYFFLTFKRWSSKGYICLFPCTLFACTTSRLSATQLEVSLNIHIRPQTVASSLLPFSHTFSSCSHIWFFIFDRINSYCHLHPNPTHCRGVICCLVVISTTSTTAITHFSFFIACHWWSIVSSGIWQFVSLSVISDTHPCVLSAFFLRHPSASLDPSSTQEPLPSLSSSIRLSFDHFNFFWFFFVSSPQQQLLLRT